MMKAKAQAKHQIYVLLNPKQKTQFQALEKQWDETIAKKYEQCQDDNV